MEEYKFLIALKEYVETTEICLEQDNGVGKSLDKLISDGDMPEVYDEILRRIKKSRPSTQEV